MKIYEVVRVKIKDLYILEQTKHLNFKTKDIGDIIFFNNNEDGECEKILGLNVNHLKDTTELEKILESNKLKYKVEVLMIMK